MAFRSLSRLSSALSAKASTLRSFLLDLLVGLFVPIAFGQSFALKQRFLFGLLITNDICFSDVLKIDYLFQSLYEVFKVQITCRAVALQVFEVASQLPL